MPSNFTHLDKRGIVKLSTKIRVAKDRTGSKASRIAARLNETTEAYWRGLSEQNAADAVRTYDDAVKLARSLGVDYQTPTESAARPFHEVRARVQTVMANGHIDDPAKRRAIMGGVEKPRIMLSSLFSTYATIQSVAIADKSERQRQKWTTQYQRAAQIFIDQIGDKPLEDVSRDDAVTYAEWWEQRVLIDGIEINTMNKNLGHLSSMFRAVIKRNKFRFDNPFAGLRQEGGKDGSRPPFPTEFIRDVILAPGALDKLNGDARDIVLLIMETGARPSELVNLKTDQIRLDAVIPHVRVEAQERDDDAPGRELKTVQSKRDIPLVGLALEAMRRHPDGFARYFDRADNFSAAANKHFRKWKLLPTPKHTVYSLRHSFKDRLKDVEAPEEMIDELMGHKIDKPKYGDGYGLRLKLKNIQAIAFTSPPVAKAA
ncbi:tyrosine-type recombinase/integrase [Bradyrhizobium sp. AUGA SZCCT0176]|uniref:phage integrase n=1 Tax=Bradyrhizobium sp. AUGA SZCCT0176 TaxID=2807664 RepID=UPI001BA5D805|nr:tyrosine-type recombinase/integrase [Bradyrhizobium sp. AUGA SZCCT0176]MBR1227240.1 tyrosine-type recombinase/integrase [Bradyrhizobium sp. AUGA SZCCT0176]